MAKVLTLLEQILTENETFSPKIDVIEYDNIYKIIIQLPGIHKKDINIRFQGNILLLDGNYPDPEQEYVNSPENLNKILYRETNINYGKFSRKIFLNFDITTTNGIVSKLENGLLTITINKNLQLQNSFSIKIND
jgi:HSP20 family protein